jgi:hypothetical protein
MLRVHISTEMNLTSIFKKNKCGTISSSCTPKIQFCFKVCVIDISYEGAHAGVSLPFVLMSQACPFVLMSQTTHLCASQVTYFLIDISTPAILSCFSPVIWCVLCLLHVLLLSTIEAAGLQLCMCLQVSSYLKQEHQSCSALPSNCHDNKYQTRPVCLTIFVGKDMTIISKCSSL